MGEIQHDIMISYSTARKEVAEDIHNYLVNNCALDIWMAPQSIPFGSRYDCEIYKAIEHSKLVLFVMSKESLSSNWCQEELRYAATSDIEVLPVRVDNEDDPYSKLRNIHHDLRRQIFELFPDYAEKIKNIKSVIDNIFTRTGEIMPRFSSDLYDPTIIGRDFEAEEIYNHLKQNHNKINIYGVGGIGKSYIIKKFITKYRDLDIYMSVHAVKFTNSIKVTIASIQFKYFDDNDYFISLKNVNITKEDALFDKKISLLRSLGSSFILFIDGVDYIDSSELEPLLTLPTTIIIVSRNKYSDSRLTNIKVSKLPLKDDMELVYTKSNLEKNEDNDTKIQKIIEEIDGHTFSLNLLSNMLRSNDVDLDYLLHYDLIELLNLNDETGDISGLITKANLSKEEMSTLKFFVFFSNGITKGTLQVIHKTLIPNLRKLVNKGLVNETIQSFQTHQIVRETILFNYDIFIDDIHEYMQSFIHIFKNSFPNKAEIIQIMESMIKNIKGSNYLIAKMYIEFGMNFNNIGWFELFHISRETFNSQNMNFFTIINENKSNFWYFEKCEELERKAIKMIDTLSDNESKKLLPLAMSYVGASYYNRTMYEEAIQSQIKASDYGRMYLEENDHTYTMILFRIAIVGNIGKIYTDQVLKNLELLEDIYNRFRGNNSINIIKLYYNKALAYKNLNEIDKSIYFFRKAIDENPDNPSTSFGRSDMLMDLAKIYKEQRDDENAKKCYLEAKSIKENIINDKDALIEFITRYDKIFL